MKHKHAEFIKKFADGENIECICESSKSWELVEHIETFDYKWVGLKFRIKPKPDYIKQGDFYHFGENGTTCDRLKLTFCGETRQLKSAEIIK
jgi:hypothetical protein